MIKAPKGCELIAADFSQIEARVSAWLSKEPSSLEVFRRNGDIYLDAASKIFGKKITKDDKHERQVGKVATLALGYGGAVGAFQAMSKGYGLKVSDRRADSIRKAWRESHPNITQFWAALEGAALLATNTELEVIYVNKQISFRKAGSFLQCRLPSGRKLTYPYPRLEMCGYYKTGYKVNTVRKSNLARDVDYQMALDADKAWEKPTLFYKSNNNGSFYHRSTYGGSPAENVTQGVARDLLAWAMMRFEHQGLKIVMHIHDEIVIEVPENSVSLDHVVELMEVPPMWAGDLPIAAQGWKAKRFKK